MTADAGESPRAQAHHVSDPLIEMDLAAEVTALRASASYRASDHAARTIAKQPGIRVVLIVFKAGGQMDEHQADSAITVHGVEGSVEFGVGEKTVLLTPGRVLTVAAGVRHRVTGVDESAVLLTIGGIHPPS